MALTFWIEENSGGPGNYSPNHLYYELDRKMVLEQNGASTAGLINYRFRKEDVTVFAAKDDEGGILPLLALPCPPWYHEWRAEALPGNILGEESGI